MALTKITKSGLTGDVVDETKIADNAISEEHLDVTSLTGHTELAATAADDDILLVYDTSAGTLKKIQRSNIALSAPTFSSVSPTSLTTGDLTGNYTIVVTGTKFDATATFLLITDGGTEIAMDSVSRDSSTQLTGTVAKNKANLTNANEPFDIKISNGNGLNTTATDQINIDAQPVYVTATGSLGSVSGGSSGSFSVNATDPESAGNVTFELQSGTLPPGLSITNTAAEGGTAIISGTATNPASTTTYNFTLRAVDAASNTSSRAFSITVNRTFTSQSFTSSGTFSVPSGVSSLSEVLVVAGGGSGASEHGGTGTGGGGAGGLVFMPEYPVTPGGTITVTVGCGGAGIPGPAPASIGNTGQDSAFGSPGDPGFSPTSAVLTAKGGGAGGGYSCGGVARAGGSGGGASEISGGSPGSGGPATQPTQPGNSGAYGFGNAGGNGGTCSGGSGAGGGGGGAGAAGTNGQPGGQGGSGGPGGDGRAYTIADGTTPVYYAGGGGGNQGGGSNGTGGQGGGTAGSTGNTFGGEANKGGGSGATRDAATSGPGGKGVVIVRY